MYLFMKGVRQGFASQLSAMSCHPQHICTDIVTQATQFNDFKSWTSTRHQRRPCRRLWPAHAVSEIDQGSRYLAEVGCRHTDGVVLTTLRAPDPEVVVAGREEDVGEPVRKAPQYLL